MSRYLNPDRNTAGYLVILPTYRVTTGPTTHIEADLLNAMSSIKTLTSLTDTKRHLVVLKSQLEKAQRS